MHPLTVRLGNRLEDYVRSQEPKNRSAILLGESAQRLGIRQSALQEVVKPYPVHIQRLTVGILGTVVNIMSGIVLHNRARGPYKGGIRLAKNVDLWETTELARLMTFGENWIAQLPVLKSVYKTSKQIEMLALKPNRNILLNRL